MAPIVRPSLKVSFSKQPKGPLPVDMLDAQIQNLIDAIHSTQEALADIRRDDGKIKHSAIEVAVATRNSRAEIDEIEQKILETGRAVANTASQFTQSARDLDLRAKDAEIAAFSAQGALSAVTQAGIEAHDAIDDVENAADEAKNAAIASQNSANYAKAQTDNAIAAKTEASQWAEYLAGPVVNSADAPAYIAGHPFGHGLYYQPVEGYGGVAGLWSAKWWAVYAAQLVGPWSFYYLGSWASPPVPGSTNPNTGIKVPNPLSPGSFYYNTTSHQLYTWDGTQWTAPFVPVLSPGYQSSFTYIATAGQQNFSGADAYGHIPVVGNNPSDVHVSGLRLVYGAGYTVDSTANRLTLATPATAGATVQWDLLFSQEDLGSTNGVNVRKVTISPAPDGVTVNFIMTYIDPGSGSQAADVTGTTQLQLSLDGTMQEPGVDYVALGDLLTMGTAPPANSKIWALWYAAGSTEAAPTNTPPVNVTLPAIVGATTVGSTLTATAGSWTGYPPPTYAYQWKSAGVNVGTNSSTYVTLVSDIGDTITVTVTATNVSGSASSTSLPSAAITGAAPANSVAPVISGSTLVGDVLTVSNDGTWSGTPSPAFSYQWKRGATNVGAGLPNYTLVTADIGANMTCVVTGTNPVGGASATSNALGPVTAVPVVPSNSTAPVVSGSAVQGSVLTSTTGTWAGSPTPTYTYQWKRAGTVNIGTGLSTYTTVSTDLGAIITCAVTATNSAGNATATSNSFGPITAPVLTGTAARISHLQW